MRSNKQQDTEAYKEIDNNNSIIKQSEKSINEEIENYKEQTLKIIEQTSTEYRDSIERVVEEVAKKKGNGKGKKKSVI
jgi:vacuolar-type H+-ATPase subunit H